MEKRSLDSEEQTIPVEKRSLDSEAQTIPVEKRSLDSEEQTIPVEKRSLDSEAQIVLVKKRGGNLKANKCGKRDVKAYHDSCLEKGYHQTKLGKTCKSLVTGSGYAKKRCKRIEKRLKNCGYSCDIDGGWSEYGPWSECSVECGGGETTRTHKCDNPAPVGEGEDCKGEAEETLSCNTHECAVDGEFGDWTDWTECSEECGRGLQNRTRECNNPAPSGGGRYCDGYKSETRLCENKPCPLTPDTLPPGILHSYREGGWSMCSRYSACGQAKKYIKKNIEVIEEETCTFTPFSEWQPLKPNYEHRYKLDRKTTPFHLQTRGLTRHLPIVINYLPARGDDVRDSLIVHAKNVAYRTIKMFDIALKFNEVHRGIRHPLIVRLSSNLEYKDPISPVPDDDVKDWTVRVTDHPGVRIDCNGVTIYDIKLNRNELHHNWAGGTGTSAADFADWYMKTWKAEESAGKNVWIYFWTNHYDRDQEDVKQMKIRIGE